MILLHIKFFKNHKEMRQKENNQESQYENVNILRTKKDFKMKFKALLLTISITIFYD